MVTNAFFYFLRAILCSEHTIPLKTVIDHSFSFIAKDGLFWLSIVTSPQLICDVTRTWSTGIMVSYRSSVLACTNWFKGNLHKWIPTRNIDFSPPSIHGLACKKGGIINLYGSAMLHVDYGPILQIDWSVFYCVIWFERHSKLWKLCIDVCDKACCHQVIA